MTDIIMEQINPYLTTIVTAVIGIFVTLLIGTLRWAQLKVDAWLAARLSVEHRELLHKIAKEAYAHAESIYKGEDGQKKLLQALTYASSRLNGLGISMSTEEIKASIHEAWLAYQPEPPRLD